MKASLPPLDREVDVMRQVIAMVEERLPVGWLVEPKRRSAANPGRSVDALIELVSPQGDDVTLVVEVKKSVVTRDLPNVVEQLRNYASRADE
jgi:hypothetical protein